MDVHTNSCGHQGRVAVLFLSWVCSENAFHKGLRKRCECMDKSMSTQKYGGTQMSAQSLHFNPLMMKFMSRGTWSIYGLIFMNYKNDDGNDGKSSHQNEYELEYKITYSNNNWIVSNLIIIIKILVHYCPLILFDLDISTIDGLTQR